MTCTTTCVQPSPSQAHCAADGCHITFGAVSGFDRHRRDGQCLTPEAIGYSADARGVYRAPMSEAGRARLAQLRDAQTAETSPEVHRPGLSESEAAETLSGARP
jgi:hypothetical protein